jgi:hypothetical protein
MFVGLPSIEIMGRSCRCFCDALTCENSIGKLDRATVGKGAEFSPLPGADRDLKSVVRDDSQAGFTGAVPGRAYENKAFDEPSLVAAMKGSQISLLHIATHLNIRKDFNSRPLFLK